MKTIVFANQKGGAGKTSLSIMFGNYISSQGKSLIIVDCDIPQQTCFRTFKYSDNPSYDVIVFDPASDQQEWKELSEDIKPYDYVIFDIPGTMLQGGILKLLSVIDKMIIPTALSPKDMDSTRIFISEFVNKLSEVPQYKVVFNKVEPHIDSNARELIEHLEKGESNRYNEFLGVEIDQVFKKPIKLERAAIEKNLNINESHKKISDRYTDLFEDMFNFVNN